MGEVRTKVYLSRYSKEEKDILRDAVDALYKYFPLSPSVDEACDFFVGLWDLCAETSETKVIYGDQGTHSCVYLRNVAIRYLHLAMMIDATRNTDCFLLSSIIQTISDTMISIIKLAEDGLEYQAVVLIRTLFELFMTLLIVVESPQKREAYRMAQTQEESYKVWRSDFTKGKFIKMLEGYAENYPDLYEPAKIWVTEAYGFLSSFVHNNSLNVMLFSKPRFDEDDVSPYSMWGEFVTRKAEIFNRMLEIVAPCDLLFYSMLEDPKIDISMKNILFEEKDIPNTIDMFWWLDALRKVCMTLLLSHESHDSIRAQLTKVDCPFYKGP